MWLISIVRWDHLDQPDRRFVSSAQYNDIPQPMGTFQARAVSDTLKIFAQLLILLAGRFVVKAPLDPVGSSAGA
jgi:hypothetical protein